MPIPRFSGGTNTSLELTTLPSMRISPVVGFSKPAMMRSIVVFPQPDGPKNVINSPSLNSSVNSFKTFTSPKDLVTWSMVITDIASPSY